MSVNLSPVGGAGAQFFDNNGAPLAGGKLYTYNAGTTTPAPAYTSITGTAFHTNPIILNASGRIPDSGEIWLSDNISYKFVLTTSNDLLLATWDNINGINSNFINYTIEEEVITATSSQTIFNLSDITYTPGTNNLSVFVDGINQIVDVDYTETNSTTVTFLSGVTGGLLVKFTTAIPVSGTSTNASVVSYTPAGANAVVTNVQAKLRERISVKDFGAVGNDVADDTTSIQNAIDYANSIGGDIYFPAGTYRISNTLLIDNSGDLSDRYKASVYGDGSASVRIHGVAGAFNMLEIFGGTSSGLHSHQVIRGLFFEKDDLQGACIQGDNLAFLSIEDISTLGGDYGFYATDLLSSVFFNCVFRFANHGFRAEYNNVSRPNSLTFNACIFGNNLNYGAWIIGGSNFNMFGGSVENNGIGGAGTKFGVLLDDAGAEGSVSGSFNGVYFEQNVGTADIWLANGNQSAAASISGCSFNRVSSSYFTTNNIYVETANANVVQTVNVSGCGFKGFNTYSPNAARPYINSAESAGGVSTVAWSGCLFESAVEIPTISNEIVLSGGPAGSVQSVTATAPVTSTGGANPIIAMAAATASVNGYMTSTYAAKLDGIAAGATVNTGNVNSGTQYQLAYYGANGTTLSGNALLTTNASADSLYVNQGGGADLRLSYNLPTLTAPGVTSTGNALALVSGFNNTTGAYTAGVAVSTLYDSAPSFSGNESTGATKMNLGHSGASWGTFYWGTAGIAPPAGVTTTFLRNDGTWATPAGGGTVTAVTASAPLASSGGNTPNLTISQSGTASNGYLSSTDWNTFNGKVSSVGASAPLSSSGGTSPSISISQAGSGSNGYLSSTDWNTFNNKTSSTFPGWNGVTYQNGWFWGGVPAATTGYYKDAFGRVYLRGVAIHSGNSSATIFTLPSGYRPVGTETYAVYGTASGVAVLAIVQIASTGAVTMLPAGDTVSFAGISFQTN